MDNFLTIELFGQTYKFKADTENTHAQEIADHLIREVAKVNGKSPAQPTGANKFAVLLAATLNISSEYLQLKRAHLELIEGLSQRSANLMQTLNTVVKQ